MAIAKRKSTSSATVMTAFAMDVDGLDNPERAKLLSVVDEFRAIGISKEISLPQVGLIYMRMSCC